MYLASELVYTIKLELSMHPNTGSAIAVDNSLSGTDSMTWMAYNCRGNFKYKSDKRLDLGDNGRGRFDKAVFKYDNPVSKRLYFGKYQYYIPRGKVNNELTSCHVKMMTWRLAYCQLDPWKQISVKFE